MATNEVYRDGVQFTVAAADITAPASPASDDPLLIGSLPAVALGDVTAGNDGVDRLTVKTNGVSEFDVTGAAGAIGVGDLLYISAAGALSNTNTGTRFGYALAAVANAATTPIPVKIGY